MLISNPIASPLALPTLEVVGGILGGALVALLAIARFDLHRLRPSVLFQRWRSWAVIAPVYALAVLSGELVTLAMLTFLVFQGLREYAGLAGLPQEYRWVLLGLGLTAAPAAMLSNDAFRWLPVGLLLAASLQPLFFQRPNGIRHLAFAALGWAWIAWLLGHLMLLQRATDGGPGLLLATGLAVALSDVGAFVVGKRFGKRKMAPRISPNKTWAGAVGNLAGAYLGFGVMAFAVPESIPAALRWGLPALIAVGAIWGDLLESAVKREFSAKDAGTWLPGFGGLLDRVDSLIVVAPLVYYAVRLLSA